MFFMIFVQIFLFVSVPVKVGHCCKTFLLSSWVNSMKNNHFANRFVLLYLEVVTYLPTYLPT